MLMPRYYLLRAAPMKSAAEARRYAIALSFILPRAAPHADVYVCRVITPSAARATTRR